jgi:outer membrane protein
LYNFKLGIAPLCTVLFAGSVSADTQFLSLAPTYIPSYFGLGVGSYPDYFGSDNNIVGIAPFGRYSFGEQRYVALEVNYATANLIEDRNWRFGPAGMWRFGREDVDDDVVDSLPDIDGSLELGFFGGYETVGSDPRDRWTLSGSFTHGVTGDNDGYTVAASLRRWIPVGRFSAFGLAIGTTYGSSDYMDTYFSVDTRGATDSGLAVFDAGAGVRDVRVTAIFMQPISEKWVIGAGILYSRLMNDAADTPIVSQRGDRDQIAFGIAIARGF